MPATNFSARFRNNGDKNSKAQSNKKSNVSARFNQEQEDRIRESSRKLVDFVSEMKQEGLLPKNFGSVAVNNRILSFFELDDKDSTLNYAFLEYKKKDFDRTKAKIIGYLADSNVSVIKEQVGKDTSDEKVERLLIDITRL